MFLAVLSWILSFLMDNLTQGIEGAHKLLEKFGFFPVFHDGEVVSVVLNRDGVSATLTLLVPEYQERKYVGDIEVVLSFLSVENLRLEGFNHQNVISSLTFKKVIEKSESSKVESPRIDVDLDTVFGMWTTFRCLRVCVEKVERITRAMDSLPVSQDIKREGPQGTA